MTTQTARTGIMSASMQTLIAQRDQAIAELNLLRAENRRLRQLNAAALRTDDQRAMRRTIDRLDSIERPIPGCERFNATYFPYYDTARRLEEALSELELEAVQ